ncbi:restriction endonuclease subunit S [Pseudarthrobacter sp. O4]|uniref:restriction endonuclease subunit S n=1 Tax=Pseudarthrobacter sp. O4 TaxID=3418417 RepID=UPI003CF3F992
MINMKEIFAFDRISDQKCELAPLTEKERGHSLLTSWDLLFARQSLTYEGAGKCSMVLPFEGERTFESHLMRVRISREIASPAFYYYYFRSSQGRRNIETIVQQVAAAGIRGSDLARLTVPFPPLSEQRAIAEILGALDDKIAANTNLASTAEQLAAVEFQQRVRALPFSEQTFGDVAKVSGGGTPSTSVPEFWNGDVLWATPTDVTALQGPYLSATSRRISEDGLAACASDLYPAGAILMTSRATIGAFALAQQPMAVNQGFIVVQPQDPELRLWFFHEMRSRVDEFISLANGATFLELSRGNFKKFKVRLAEPQVMKEFVAVAEPLHAAASNGLSENTKLATTRDTLLPQLMSGKLRVKEAERVLEEAGV